MLRTTLSFLQPCLLPVAYTWSSFYSSWRAIILTRLSLIFCHIQLILLCFYSNVEDPILALVDISKSSKLPTYPTPPSFINHHYENVECCVIRGVWRLLVFPALMDEDPSGRTGQAGLGTAAVWPCCPNTVVLVLTEFSLPNKYYRDLD